MCREAGLHAWVLDSGDLPDNPADRERLARAYTRECALWPAALLRAHRRTGAARGAGGMAAPDHTAGGRGRRERLDRGTLERLASGLALVSTVKRKAEWTKHLGAAAAAAIGRRTRRDRRGIYAGRQRDPRNSAGRWRKRLPPEGRKHWQAVRGACAGGPRAALWMNWRRVWKAAAGWPDLVLPKAQTAILHRS